jgi:ATP-dependent Clp protease ATP-binding subunit ClpB
MDLSKFTEKSQAALTEAQNIATRNQHQAVDVEHLLLALLSQEDGLIPRLFERANAAPALLQTKVEEELNRIPRVSGDSTTSQGLYVTQRMNKLLVKAQDEAKRLKDEYVSVEHLVLAMFDEPATTGVGKIFKTLGVRRDEFSQGAHRSARQSARHQRQSRSHL